jgi:negative regulator of replication initiation
MDDSKLTPSVYDVTLELLRSPEFQQVYAYWKILGREQDEAGQQHFAKIAAGDTDQPWALSVAQVVDELLRSDEFMERIQKLAALEGAEVNLVLAQAKTYAAVLKHFRLSDACVAFLYIKILGRYPDNGAKAHYATVMVDEILSVQQFTEELLRSDEFVAQVRAICHFNFSVTSHTRLDIFRCLLGRASIAKHGLHRVSFGCRF